MLATIIEVALRARTIVSRNIPLDSVLLVPASYKVLCTILSAIAILIMQRLNYLLLHVRIIYDSLED